MHEGVDGLLRDKSRPPGKAPIPPDRVAEIVRLTQQPPPHEATHWTRDGEDRAGLDSLRRRYNAKMQVGANASGFDLLTGNFDRTKTAFRELSQQVATLDTVDPFMAGCYEAAKRQQLSN